MNDATKSAVPDGPENTRIAGRLRQYADLLEAQDEDGFRVRAYRTAADEIDGMATPLQKIFAEEGLEGLIRLRGIGRGIAAAISEMLVTGRWSRLDRLTGESTPEELFTTIPGVGPTLAQRLVDALDVDTLEDLETALRLGHVKVPGFGARRREAVLAALGARLAGIRHRLPRAQAQPEPPVSLLLDADALYRAKADADELPRIAPHRFNPTKEAWLPIMHAKRDAWHLTVLYSNTARAHELDRIRDWVVIYFHTDDGPEGRRTIVTERRGPLAGHRVVRGREDDCIAHYKKLPAAKPAAGND